MDRIEHESARCLPDHIHETHSRLLDDGFVQIAPY